jgi:hypothetical protein
MGDAEASPLEQRLTDHLEPVRLNRGMRTFQCVGCMRDLDSDEGHGTV